MPKHKRIDRHENVSEQLYQAICELDVMAVKILIGEEGLNPKYRSHDHKKLSFLHLVIEIANEEIENASEDSSRSEDSGDETELEKEVDEKCAEIIKALLKIPGIELDTVNDEKVHVLMSATFANLSRVVQVLLNCTDINPNLIEKDGNFQGYAPIHMARTTTIQNFLDCDRVDVTIRTADDDALSIVDYNVIEESYNELNCLAESDRISNEMLEAGLRLASKRQDSKAIDAILVRKGLSIGEAAKVGAEEILSRAKGFHDKLVAYAGHATGAEDLDAAIAQLGSMLQGLGVASNASHHGATTAVGAASTADDTLAIDIEPSIAATTLLRLGQNTGPAVSSSSSSRML